MRSVRKVSVRYIYACYVSCSTCSTQMFFLTHTSTLRVTLEHTQIHIHSYTLMLCVVAVFKYCFQDTATIFRVCLFCGACCAVSVSVHGCACVCVYYSGPFLEIVKRNSQFSLTKCVVRSGSVFPTISTSIFVSVSLTLCLCVSVCAGVCIKEKLYAAIKCS